MYAVYEPKADGSRVKIHSFRSRSKAEEYASQYGRDWEVEVDKDPFPYRWYRGYMITMEFGGWTLEYWDGKRIPVYKTLEDAKNAIRKFCDSTQKAEPRIIKYMAFDTKTMTYYLWEGNEE